MHPRSDSTELAESVPIGVSSSRCHWLVVKRDCVISWQYAFNFAFYIFFRNLTCHWFLYIKDYVEAVVEVKVLILDLENSTDCQKDKLSVSKGRRYTVTGPVHEKVSPRSNINQPVQLQSVARKLKFHL